MSRSLDDPSPLAPAAGKPTLEMLLRAKRAERPDDAFWSDFERSFRQKQLAASIEPRPWWLGFVLLGRRMGPIALPASAFAAALVAVVAVRLHDPVPAEAGLAQAPSSAVAPAAAGAEPQEAASPALVAAAQPESAVDAPPTLGEGDETLVASIAATSPAVPDAAAAVSAAPAAPSAPTIPVVATLLELPAADATQPTPSELTIAQNLATVRAELAAVTSAANGPGFAAPQTSRSVDVQTASSDSLVAEPSAPAVSPRHARLLAMAEEAMADRRDLAAVRERMAHRLAHDDTNYGSSSRLGVGGDRFSLSF